MTVIRGPWRHRAGRHDDANAERWRGDLFGDMKLPRVCWKEGASYGFLKPPKSVTFPICACCDHIIWEWPHYEEEVPEDTMCDRCAEEELSA